jgi:GMP synthase PP-ATPase subunit
MELLRLICCHFAASQFIQRGFSWEERLIKQLRDAGHNVILGAQSDNTRQTDVKIAVQEFLRELSQLQNTTDKSRRVFFYQPTLVALPSVYADLEIDNALMELGTCYPDLIEVEFKEPSTCIRSHPFPAL